VDSEKFCLRILISSMEPPIFDHKLWADCQLKATGANVHKLKNQMSIYISEFQLVEQCGKSWNDPFDGGIRADLVKKVEQELRKELNK